MPEGARESRPVATAFVRLFVIDLLTSGSLLLGWIDSELAATDLLLILGGLRLVATFAYLWHLLGPVKRWQAAEASDDASLLEADAAIQTLFKRMLVVQVLGWAISLGVPLALRIADPLEALLPAEIVYALALLSVAMVFNPSIMFACFRQLCDALTAELGPQLATRGLRPPRERRSSARELVLLGMAVAFSTLSAAGSSGFSVEAKRTYEAIEAEQREQLLRAANSLALGASLDALGQGIELRTRAELDRALVAELPAVEGDHTDSAPVPGTLVSTIDAGSSQVLAGYALSEARWLQVARPIGGEMGPWLFGFVVYMIIMVGLVGLTMHWLTQALIGPIGRLGQALHRMSHHGELDTIVRLSPARDDEVGALVENFNATHAMLSELVGAARAVSAGDLSVELEHSGDLHDAFRLMVSQLREMVDRIRATALDVSSASAEIHAAIAHQTALVERHAGEVEAAGETIHALADAASEIDGLSARVLGDAESNRTNVDRMVAKIGELSRETEGVGALLEQIREVAERSDLLALNGSLEATRAGEAGRGFALVAAEMRRLAERITGVVADVRVRVAAIDETGGAAVSVTEEGRRLADDTAEVARAISELSQVQRRGSEEAATMASALAEVVRGVSAGMVQTGSTADSLHERAVELERLTRSFELD